MQREIFIALFAVTTVLGESAAAANSVQRPITVADSIAMTRLADPGYNGEGPEGFPVAQFSPDGTKFVIVLRKGNLERNVNEYSIYLFHTSEAVLSPKPDLLVTMATSSNQEAVKDLRWLDDNETLVFLGEQPGTPAQVYTYNVRTRKLAQLTHHSTTIKNYAITRKGEQLVYVAEAPPKPAPDKEHEIIIDGQFLDTLLAADASYKADDDYWTDQLFSQRARARAVEISLHDPIWVNWGADLHLSPDGRYCLVPTTLDEVPAWWQEYNPSDQIENTTMKLLSSRKKHRKGEKSTTTQLTLVDTQKATSKVFLDTPMAPYGPLTWAADSGSVYFQGYLPLNIADFAEKEARAKGKVNEQLAVPSGNALKKLSDDEWKAKTEHPQQQQKVSVTIEEDLNTPPKIYASDTKTKQKALLLDLNPQFKDLQFGKVEVVEWEVTPKIKAKGGLYFPPDYKPGQRYPLVIQTHGFGEHDFSMDGTEFHSAHAARALAAKGFLVLQAYELDPNFNHDDCKQFGITEMQAGQRCETAIIEAPVDYLNAKRLIDPARVGIVGYSITVADVAYMLTHPKHHYAAAILTNGVDWGYFNRVAVPIDPWENDQVYDGKSPFVDLHAWMDAPGFNLDKVTTPVRLVALSRSSVVEQWEWYVGLSDQDRPVDYVMLPDADHIVFKPYERQVVQQGLVDWFCFWLKGEEDPDPAKTVQYKRWRELRKFQDAENANSVVAAH